MKPEVERRRVVDGLGKDHVPRTLSHCGLGTETAVFL